MALVRPAYLVPVCHESLSLSLSVWLVLCSLSPSFCKLNDRIELTTRAYIPSLFGSPYRIPHVHNRHPIITHRISNSLCKFYPLHFEPDCWLLLQQVTTTFSTGLFFICFHFHLQYGYPEILQVVGELAFSSCSGEFWLWFLWSTRKIAFFWVF